MLEYMTESEAWAVARWQVGSCLAMVHKSKQVGLEPMFESLHSWSISYAVINQLVIETSWRFLQPKESNPVYLS